MAVRIFGLATLLTALPLALATLPAGAAGAADKRVAAEETSWPFLVEEVFQNRPIHDGSGLIALEAPVNHPDAGAIPIVIRAHAPADGPQRIEKITLLVDENPSPVVAVFDMNDSALVSKIETTIRVNRFSYVHLVAETEDGTLYAVDRYVKGSGGCSARGVVLPEVAEKTLGEMTFAQSARKPAGPEATEREVTVRVTHPNYTGMQQNYVTLHYILAHFVTRMQLRQGDSDVMSIESGISVSENPTFKVTYASAAKADALTFDVTDSEGLRFQRSWPLDQPGS